MHKWGTVTIAYREANFIVPHLEGLIDAGYERNLVICSEKPFFGKEWPDDGTVQLAEKAGAEVVTGVFPRDEQMLNLGSQLLQDCDRILFLAPDEFLTKEDHAKLREFVQKNERFDAFAITNMSTYFKKPYYRIEPKESQTEGRKYIYHPVIVINPRTAKWRNIRDQNGTLAKLPSDICLHHFAYLRTDEEVKRKMEVNSNADVVDANWYDEVWLNWTPEMRNFHPEFPEQFEGVVVEEPPKEIMNLLRNHPCVK